MSLIRTFRRDMKGLPKYYSLSQWILRLSLMIFVILNYGHRLTNIDITSEYFILSLSYLVLCFMIIIGGFAKTSELTRLAAILLLIIVTAHMSASFLVYKKFSDYHSTHLLFFAVILHFVTSSKRNDFYYKSRFERDDIDIEEESIRMKTGNKE